MSTSRAQRHLINATTDKKHRVKLYKVGKRWIAMGLTTAALGIAGFATTASAATTDTTTDSTDATTQNGSEAASNADAIQQPQVTISNSTATNTNTAADINSVNSSSAADQTATPTTTQTQATTSATTETATTNQTSVAAPKTTNLGDATATDIETAKVSAANDYQTTDQAQTITAVSDAIVTDETGIDLATAKTIQGDPIADVTGQYYYSTNGATTDNIVEHYQNWQPALGTSVHEYSPYKSGQIPLTEPGVPVIEMETVMPDMDISQLRVGGLTAVDTFSELGLPSAKSYSFVSDGTVYSDKVNVYIGAVRYADGTSVDTISDLKFTDSVPAYVTVNPSAPEHADLLIDYVADGQNYRTVKTVSVRILDQKPQITTAQGILVIQTADNKSVQQILNYSATDPEDGEVPVSATGLVDLTTPGTYNVTLRATDTNGVTTTRETSVTVIAKPAIQIPIEYEDATTGTTLHEDETAINDYDTAGGIPTYAIDGYTIGSEVINLSEGSGSIVADFSNNTLTYYSGLSGKGNVVHTQALNSLTDDKLAAMGINQAPAGTIYLGFADYPTSIASGYNIAQEIASIKFLYTKNAIVPQSKTSMPDPTVVSSQDYYDNRTTNGTGTSTTTPQVKTSMPDPISVSPQDYYDNRTTDGTGTSTTTPQVKTSMPDPVSVTADEYYNNLVPDDNGTPTTNKPTGTPTGNNTNTGTPTTTGTTDSSTVVTTDNNTATNGDSDADTLASDDSNATGLDTNTDNDATTSTDANNASVAENDATTTAAAPQAAKVSYTTQSQAITANKLPQTNESTPKTSTIIGLALLAASSTLGLVVKKRKQD